MFNQVEEPVIYILEHCFSKFDVLMCHPRESSNVGSDSGGQSKPRDAAFLTRLPGDVGTSQTTLGGARLRASHPHSGFQLPFLCS